VVELEQNQQGAEIPDFIVHGCLMLDLLGGAYVVKRSYLQVNLWILWVHLHPYCVLAPPLSLVMCLLICQEVIVWCNTLETNRHKTKGR
jgi:hypothetical protein